MEAMHAPIHFEKFEVLSDMKKVPQDVIHLIRKNKVELMTNYIRSAGKVCMEIRR